MKMLEMSCTLVKEKYFSVRLEVFFNFLFFCFSELYECARVEISSHFQACLYEFHTKKNF